jgi:S1-C subfamily serine protease
MRMSLWIGVGIGTVALLVIAGVTIWLMGGKPTTTLPTNLVLASNRITSIEGAESEERLKDALGFVVCGAKLTLFDGSIREIASSTGTAFSVTEDGYMLTNRHVVEETADMMRADKLKDTIIETLKLEDLQPMVWVFVGADPYQAKVVHVSSDYDLAILKIDRKNCRYFALSTTDKLARLDRVYALGFPAAATDPLTEWGAEEKAARLKNARNIKANFTPDNFVYTQQEGTISAVMDRTEDRTGRVIQHSASLNPGNSGGPLVGREGTVRGVNTFRIKEAQNINFALCTPQLKREIQKYVPEAKWVE